MINDKISGRAFKIYKDYYLRAVILEIVTENGSLDLEKAGMVIAHKINDDSDQDVLWKTTPKDSAESFGELIKLGLLQPDETGKHAVLTDYGINAVRKATWHVTASNMWVGYKSLVIANKALNVAYVTLVISLLVFVFTLLAIFK
jgi:hypothetical protein